MSCWRPMTSIKLIAHILLITIDKFRPYLSLNFAKILNNKYPKYPSSNQLVKKATFIWNTRIPKTTHCELHILKSSDYPKTTQHK